MNYFYFILGRENKISQTELECVLASFGFDLKSNPILILSDQVAEIKLENSETEIKKLIDVLGGTVKIYQKIISSNEKISDLIDKEDPSKKILFGISNYTKDKIDTFKLALSAKKSSKKPIRVINGKEDGILSSAQSFQYKMDSENLEYGLFDDGIGRLIAVQNIDEWTRHDYGKPRSDAKSGMLPPKLARIMVNLAVGQIGQRSEVRGQESESGGYKEKSLTSNLRLPTIVDPFCGSGNILIEALSIGCRVIGSDVSDKAVEDTKTNLEWLIQNSKIKNQNCNSKFIISKADATKFDFSQIENDFVVVTEPYLGEPRNAKLRIEEEAEAKKEITKLYLDFLRNLKLTSSRLKTICLVFPLFELANGKKLSIFSESVDFLNQIGYTSIYPPLKYGRDYQVVKREIVLLKVKN